MPATFCHSCRQEREPDQQACPACNAKRPHQGWPVDPFIGRLIDEKYRIEKRLAAGGFGTVFLATHLHGQHELGRVVIKFLHSELAHDAAIAKRFVTEAKAARELTSPHVVRVFDLGFSDEGVPFMIQEYITGESLDAVMKKVGRVPVERVVEVGLQVSEAMDEAHSKGILHRDLKPENLRITPQRDRDFVKVLDFGIARVDSGKSVATNSFIGTPRYMAPEQIKQKELDGRADVFALGVILFEMLTGEAPIPADSEMEYIHLNLISAPRDVRSLRPNVPPALADLVMRMMEKDRNKRPGSMAIVYTELHALAQLHPEIGKGREEDTGARRMAERASYKPSTTAKQVGVVDAPGTMRPAATQTGTPAISPAVHTIHPAGMRSNRGLLIGGALALVVAAGVLLGLAISRRTTPPAVGVPIGETTGGGGAAAQGGGVPGVPPGPALPPGPAVGTVPVANPPTTTPAGNPPTTTPVGNPPTTTPVANPTPPGPTVTAQNVEPDGGPATPRPTKRPTKRPPAGDPFTKGHVGVRGMR